jgi:ribosomal protein RSM22 (predicted rRNA methylase)
MDLCTPEGRLLRNTVAKSNMHHIPSLYTALRKTTWGGLFPVLAGECAYIAVGVRRVWFPQRLLF